MSPPAPAEAASAGDDRRSADAAATRAVAAIDCGTNSTRLLIADGDGVPIERLMRITRLGEGVDVNRRLRSEAIDRTISVLRDYREIMDQHGVTGVRMAATSAARDAENRDEFFSAAESVVGAPAELLGGDEEGRLSFLGATHDAGTSPGPWLIADIGGGSTEIAFGDQGGANPSVVRSLDIGCVRITERFLSGDPPSNDSITSARGYVSGLLTETTREHPAITEARTFLGLAGTVSALASIEQEIHEYDRSKLHHHVLARSKVEDLLSLLAGETVEARRRRPGMEPDRADVIVGGAVVLAEIMAHFGLDSCLTSEADILDGMVIGLLAR